MSTTALSMRAGSGVQLHPLYSLAGAVVGTTLVCACLLWAFTYPLALTVAPRFVTLHLATIPTNVLPSVVRTIPRQARPLRRSAVTRPAPPRPAGIPESSPVKPISPSVPLDLTLPSVFAPPPTLAFVPHAFNPYSDLSRVLNTPLPASTMQNGDAYRSVSGFPVVKSGGRCLALQTIQVGLSPSAHVTVGFGVPCPGEYRPSMADELRAWAAARASRKPRPPG